MIFLGGGGIDLETFLSVGGDGFFCAGAVFVTANGELLRSLLLALRILVGGRIGVLDFLAGGKTYIVSDIRIQRTRVDLLEAGLVAFCAEGVDEDCFELNDGAGEGFLMLSGTDRAGTLFGVEV